MIVCHIESVKAGSAKSVHHVHRRHKGHIRPVVFVEIGFRITRLVARQIPVVQDDGFLVDDGIIGSGHLLLDVLIEEIKGKILLARCPVLGLLHDAPVNQVVPRRQHIEFGDQRFSA